MAFVDMYTEVRGAVPKLPFPYAKTLVNEAWRTIREQNLWSFQLFEGQWTSPPLQTGVGTATATIGNANVTLDATALAALNAALALQPYSLITQRQFRIALSGIYNIWAFDSVGGVLSLDRPWGEPTVTSAAYQIYQCYYAPTVNAGAATAYVSDFKKWISVRSIPNFIALNTTRMNREKLDAVDPQRFTFSYPSDVVPYLTDQNPLSATFGNLLYELWGAPLSNWTFQLFGIRRGLPLVLNSDTLPPMMGEDCVKALAKVQAYEWAEANRDMTPRSTTPDYKYLMGKAQKQHTDLLRMYRRADRESVDNWFSVRRSALGASSYGYYNSISQTANPGGLP